MASAQGIRAGKAFVELYANDNKLVRGLRSAQRKLKRFGTTVTTMGMQMAKAASIIAIPLALSLKIGANFEDQMSKVKAVTSGTAAEFDTLNKKAKELGRTTSFTATQVAEGMVGLGRAGFSRKEIDQAIGGMLNLARATDTEMAEATDIAAAALRQFNLEASEMGRVSDVLTATANGSAQTLTDLGESLKYVAPIASEAGESIETTNAALGIMANNGIKGSLAGTALARAYKNLADTKTEETMQAIGVAVADANGDLRPMAEILKDIGEATADMGNKQRLSIFEDLFGRGQAAALKLAKSGLQIDDMLEKITQSQGLAAKASAEMDDNLGGSFRMFMSAAEGVAIAVKDAITTPLRGLLGTLTKFLNKMAEWIEANQGVVKVIAVIGGVLAVVAGALIALGGTVAVISFAMGGLATAVTAVSATMAFLATPMAGAIAMIVAIVGAIGGLIAMLVKYKDAIKGFGKTVLSVFGLIVKYFSSGIFSLAAELVWSSLKVIWETGVSDLSKTFDKLTEAWKVVIDNFVNDWKKAIGEVNAEAKNLEPGNSNNLVPKSEQKKPGGPDGSFGGYMDWLMGGVGSLFTPPAQNASEGVIEIVDVTPDQMKAENQRNANNVPIMPEFAPEPPGEDPAVKEAREKLDAAQKRLSELEVKSAETKSVRTGDNSTALRGIVSFLNQSAENKTLDEIRTTNTILAQVYDQLRKNKLATTEAS